jgi:hypothetical protein
MATLEDAAAEAHEALIAAEAAAVARAAAVSRSSKGVVDAASKDQSLVSPRELAKLRVAAAEVRTSYGALCGCQC